MAGATKKDGLDVKLENMLSGIESMGSSIKLGMNEGQVSKSDLTTLLQNTLAPFQAAETAHNELKAKLAVREAAMASAQQTYKAVETAVRAYFGSNPTTLATFGIDPPKAKRQLTAEEKLARKLKIQATRKLRNTMGSRKKETVKATGAVTISTSVGDAAPTSSVVGIPSPAPVSAQPAPIATPVSAPVAAPVVSAPAPVASAPAQPPAVAAPVGNGATATNGVSNGAVAPMLANGAGH